MPTGISYVDESKQKLCECGCGQPVKLAPKTDNKKGWIKGQPVRFIVGHASRKQYTMFVFAIDKITGCWIWQGSKISTGYGNLRIGDKNVLAHRYIYEMVNGKIPEDLELDHLCKTPLCVNPTHLETVTHAENCRRGKRAKLSLKKAKAIRALGREGWSLTYIAKKYGVDRHTIRSILQGKAWS